MSVLIPLYNKEHWIARSISSVLQQSMQSFEIVVVDDGSSDGGAKIVEDIGDSRLRLFRQENAGVSAARNRALSLAKGEYVAFLDADDLWCPRHLERLVSLLDERKDFLFAAEKVEYTKGFTQREELHRLCERGRDGAFGRLEYIRRLYRNRFDIHLGSILFRKEPLLEHAVTFAEGVRLGEDINFILRCDRIAPAALVESTGMLYSLEDSESAMRRRDETTPVFPDYFASLRVDDFDDEELDMIRAFLGREYRKFFYANRGKRLDVDSYIRDNPFFSPSFIDKIVYRALLSLPSWLVELYRALK